MTIEFLPEQSIFHLSNDRISYALHLLNGKHPSHLYWGKKIRTSSLAQIPQYRTRSSFSPVMHADLQHLSLDAVQLEYPGYGSGDFRHPAYQVELENGTTVTEAVYQGHRIISGKPQLTGLPATYVEQDGEAETLEMELKDAVSGLVIVLAYTIFAAHDVIARSVRFKNEGPSALKLLRALSVSVDFPRSNYELLQLSGAWTRERMVHRRALAPGMQGVESRRGSSSHNQNPFLALLTPGADEDHGEVYGFSLVYSGNFTAQAEVEQYGTTRVTMGINPFDFTWLLEPGESFQTPEAVMVYSSAGLGDMSRTYHKLYQSRLARGQFRDAERPVLVNNWEATYFNFTADKIESIAKVGKELGIEMFVLDDGWFGKRDSDNCSLGDWYVDRNKLPQGLEDLVERVRRLDMRFGLWFEPEMVSPDSDLYRAHPDWCLHVPDRRRTEARQQLILDFSRQDVCEAIYTMVADILRSAPITYVKWDMNRNMTEIGSALLPANRQRETAHRYMLGLYSVLERITAEFPHILFESCSGGGGRFDPGMLHYMPQTWTSDNTDAVTRLKIQYGTSMVYPAVAMGAHVSAVPNHQVKRMTSLDMRGHVAMSGNFGYELDLTEFTEAEKMAVRQQVALYKQIRPVVQFGLMYRLLSPFEGNETAWMFVAPDQTEAVVFYYRVLATPNEVLVWLPLKGLNADYDYAVEGSQDRLGGDYLMHAGLSVPDLSGDYQSAFWHLKKI